MRKAVIPLIVLILCVSAGICAYWFYFKDATPQTQNAQNLEDHLSAELARLKAERNTGNLPDAEQRVADSLAVDADVGALKTAMAMEFTDTLADRLAAYLQSRNFYGLARRRSQDNQTDGRETFEHLIASANRNKDIADELEPKIRNATTDTAGSYEFRLFLQITASLEENAKILAQADHIEWRSRDDVQPEALVTLAKLISLRAELLTVTNAEEPLAGTAALWRAISLLPTNDEDWLEAQSKAVHILLSAGAVNLFADGQLNQDDFQALVGIGVEMPTLADVAMLNTYRMNQELYELAYRPMEYWELDEDVPVRIINDLHQRHGPLSLDQWIDAEFEVRKQAVEPVIRLAESLHKCDDLKEPENAKQALEQHAEWFEQNEQRVRTWLLTWLQHLQLTALKGVRMTLGDNPYAMQSIVRETSAPYIHQDVSGETLTLRLDPEHPLAKYYPPECREAFATLQLEK